MADLALGSDGGPRKGIAANLFLRPRLSHFDGFGDECQVDLDFVFSPVSVGSPGRFESHVSVCRGLGLSSSSADSGKQAVRASAREQKKTDENRIAGGMLPRYGFPRVAICGVPLPNLIRVPGQDWPDGLR